MDLITSVSHHRTIYCSFALCRRGKWAPWDSRVSKTVTLALTLFFFGACCGLFCHRWGQTTNMVCAWQLDEASAVLRRTCRIVFFFLRASRSLRRCFLGVGASQNEGSNAHLSIWVNRPFPAQCSIFLISADQFRAWYVAANDCRDTLFEYHFSRWRKSRFSTWLFAARPIVIMTLDSSTRMCRDNFLLHENRRQRCPPLPIHHLMTVNGDNCQRMIMWVCMYLMRYSHSTWTWQYSRRFSCDTGRHQVFKLLHNSHPKEVRRSMLPETGILAQRNLPQVTRQRTYINDPNENGQLGLTNHETDVGKNKIQTYPVEDTGEKNACLVVDSDSDAHRSQMMTPIRTSFVRT